MNREDVDDYPVSYLLRRIEIIKWMIIYKNRRNIGYERITPSTKDFEYEDTHKFGRLETSSHSDTICECEKFRKLLVAGVVRELGGFGEVMVKSRDVEICTTCTGCDDTKTEDIYIIVFGK